MRLGICVYVIRGDEMLFVRYRSSAGEMTARVPSKFLDGDQMPKTAAMQLVKETTGLHPTELRSSGTIFFRPPRTVETNVLVWVCHVPPSADPIPPDDGHVWLTVSPELSPDIPFLDRTWLPLILAHEPFEAHVHYFPNGEFDRVRVRRKNAIAPTP